MKTSWRTPQAMIFGMAFAAATSVIGLAGEPSADSKDFPAAAGWKPLFNCKNLDGWKFRNPAARKVWVVCDQVRLDPGNSGRLLPVGEGGGPSAVLLCGDDGRGSDIMTTENFGDYQLHLAFTVPKGSNSGVYNRGLFEIQYLRQLWCFQACLSRLRHPSYERAIPALNLSRPPGEWQTYDITMKGKTLSLVWNGKSVYRDMDVRYGETDQGAYERLNQENAGKTEALRVKLRHENGKYLGYFGDGATRSGLDGPDRPGPILLQGDHGPVAFRNLFIRPCRD